MLALLGTLAVQKGVLWWAANHRVHHKYSDQEGDVHSPVRTASGGRTSAGSSPPDYEETAVRPHPRHGQVSRAALAERALPGAAGGARGRCSILVGGLPWLVWGFFISTTLLWHATFTINSLSHVFGSRRYETGDASRNNVWLALLTMGEGWHNNHHRYMNSVRQGFFWWEVDASYYILKALSWLGLVWDLHQPPARLLLPEAQDAGRGRERERGVAAAPVAAGDAQRRPVERWCGASTAPFPATPTTCQRPQRPRLRRDRAERRRRHVRAYLPNTPRA